MYKVVDLFAGAGGLSLGFLQTQKYQIKVAFENNPAMQETYRRNHMGVDVRGDVCGANYKEIQKKYGPIDVVIGGPPCQGFSNANRQKNRVINQNNMLVKQYIRAILELQPKAFVMENVSMLRSDVHRFYLDENDEGLIRKYHVPMSEMKLQLLDKDFVFEGAVEIVKCLPKIERYLWSEEWYSVINVIYKNTKNQKKLAKALLKHRRHLEKIFSLNRPGDSKDYIESMSDKAVQAIRGYYDGYVSLTALRHLIEPAIMIQRMLSRAKEIFDNQLVVEKYDSSNGICAVIQSYAVFDYLNAILGSEPNNYSITADILCAADYGAPQKRMRFIAMGIKRSLSGEVKLPIGRFTERYYRTVREAIEDLEDVTPLKTVSADVGTVLVKKRVLSELGAMLRDTDRLKNHVITDTQATAMERFKALKQGENFHSLDDTLKTNTYTDIRRTQNTIYLRLDYEQPSGTVVNVRKSMWVHPVLDRAVSIREAARLQTFPDSFVFYGSKDKQYQQVGNAVPPIMARAIAEALDIQLEKGLNRLR